MLEIISKNIKNNIWIFAIIIIVLLVVFIFKNRKDNKNKIANRYTNKIHWADDVTRMNKAIVERVIFVKSVDDVIKVVEIGNKEGVKVIARGQTHTMGGHTIAKNGYILDMKYMNHITNFNKNKKLITVEPGLTWCDLIFYLDDYGLSPMTLQSYSSFSIGGTISVNAHGITNDDGIYKSIENIKMINSDGKKILCDRINNHELFSLIIGGYGLFGIIYSVTLKVVPNIRLKMEMKNLNINSFTNNYSKVINDPTIKIKLARINIVNMEDISLYIFRKVNNTEYISSHIDDNPHEMSKASQLMYKWILPNKKIQQLRYFIEKVTKKPMDWSNMWCERNKLLHESAEPLAKLYCPLINVDRTHILQEYFIPDENFISWMKYLKKIFVKKKFAYINLLNITIRYIKKDDETFLKYAKKNMYAFVFYYRSFRHKKADKELKYLHNLLVDKTLELKGTFYLPYRHHYSYKQLLEAYPQIIYFFLMKRKYDPSEVFSNMWYKHYKNILMIPKINSLDLDKKNLLSIDISNSNLVSITNNDPYSHQKIFSSI